MPRTQADVDRGHRDGDPGAGGLEAELGWSLHRVSMAFRQSAMEAVADLPGGSRGYQVLVAVDAGPPSSQLALAQRLGIDKTAMTYLVDELVTADLVTRRPHPADRRVRHVVITPVGRRARTRTRRALRSVEEQLLGVLDPAETAQLRSLLVRVARSTDRAESCVTTPDGTSEDPVGGSAPAPAQPSSGRGQQSGPRGRSHVRPTPRPQRMLDLEEGSRRSAASGSRTSSGLVGRVD